MYYCTIEGKAHEAAQTLRNKPGVRTVDMLEGSPSLVIAIQARIRQRLADLTNKALASVETMTDNWQLLPVQNGCNTVSQA
jgi:hypothetical protein